MTHQRMILLLLFMLITFIAGADTLTGQIEYRIRSALAGSGDFGQASDKTEYGWGVAFTSDSSLGEITQLYRGDRTAGSASADVIGLVGSLTNPLGNTVSMSILKGLYVQNLGTSTLTLAGIATATIPAYGTFSLTGLFQVASISDVLNVQPSGTATYRIWMVGE